MKKLLVSGVLVAASLGSIAFNAQANEAGEKIYQSVCKNCHGPTARGMASFPRLSDKTAEYLTMRLQQYRAGEKVGSNTALMQPHAANLSDDDISNLAAYISTAFQ